MLSGSFYGRLFWINKQNFSLVKKKELKKKIIQFFDRVKKNQKLKKQQTNTRYNLIDNLNLSSIFTVGTDLI